MILQVGREVRPEAMRVRLESLTYGLPFGACYWFRLFDSPLNVWVCG